MKSLEELQTELRELYDQSYQWALNCCGYHVESAEEVLQESYIKALKAIERFQGDSSLKTWFFTIIRNTSKDVYRKKTRTQDLVDSYEREAKQFKTATQEIRFRKANDRQKIFELMEKLSAREKEILELVVYQEMKIKEAAEVMGVTLGSASSYLKRAKKNMQGMLEKPEIPPQDKANFDQTWTSCLELHSRKKAS
jgi:RNA polymerase sigma-70 factor (ECF subfamily)